MFQGAVTPGRKLPAVKQKRTLLAEDVWLAGYTGKDGCFTIRPTGKDTVEVGFHPHVSPDILNQEHLGDVEYREYSIHPGWAFAVMADLKGML